MALTLQHRQTAQLFGLQTTSTENLAVRPKCTCNTCRRHDAMTSDFLNSGGIGLGGGSLKQDRIRLSLCQLLLPA